jgi:hypothetical protein
MYDNSTKQLNFCLDIGVHFNATLTTLLNRWHIRFTLAIQGLEWQVHHSSKLAYPLVAGLEPH